MGKVKEIARKAIELGECAPEPFGCGKTILDSDWKDDLSRKEYRISALCQKCQDDFFKEDDE